MCLSQKRVCVSEYGWRTPRLDFCRCSMVCRRVEKMTLITIVSGRAGCLQHVRTTFSVQRGSLVKLPVIVDLVESGIDAGCYLGQVEYDQCGMDCQPFSFLRCSFLSEQLRLHKSFRLNPKNSLTE